MKASFTLAAVAAFAGFASAGNVHHRHAHDVLRLLENRANNGTVNGTGGACVEGCTTYYTTIYGTPGLYTPPAPPKTTTTTVIAVPTTTSAPPPPPTTTTKVVVAVVVPTPIAQTCSTTGVYTFPATTVTVTESTTVCAVSSTSVPSGTHTLGGVTTVVTTATTVVCPYATQSTSAGVVTNVIATTTYVCPSAGTYTIAPVTTVCATETIVNVPVVTVYAPGTYTAPAVVTTVLVANTVIYCPFSIPTTPAPAPPAVTTVTPVVVPASSAPVVVASAAPSTPAVSSSNITLGGSGKGSWAVTYTPYLETAGSGCKSSAQVMADIAIIAASGANSVRVYSTDCSTLENVGAACSAYGLKMIIGIFIDTAGCHASNPSVEEQISAIAAWARWDLVELVAVGNEAIFNGFCSAEQLASLITTCKSAFSGYTGLWTVTEVVGTWQSGSVATTLCPLIDIAAANAHAFFNAQTTAEQAGIFVKGQLDIMNGICPGKAAKILETGWPSQGNPNGVAVPGVTEQLTAISAIISSCGSEVVLFSFSSDAWKSSDSACACEPYWGVKTILPQF